MESAEKERDQLITLLLRESLNGKINWAAAKIPYSLGQATENYVSLFLEATYKDSRIGVYEIRQKYFTDVDEYYWSENIGICIIKDHDLVVWKSEGYSPALRELINAASYQASGIKKLLSN